MNIILKSFLLSLAIVIAIVAFGSIFVLPEIYSLIIFLIFVFFGIWTYLYFSLK